MGEDKSKLSFLRTSLRFHSALAILEPRSYVVLEQFGAENISLRSGRLVFKKNKRKHSIEFSELSLIILIRNKETLYLLLKKIIKITCQNDLVTR